MDQALTEGRHAVLIGHFTTETDHEFDRTLATFNGQPHYEIMATGEVSDGAEEVMGYYRGTRTAFPDQRHEHVRFHVADDSTIAEFDLLGTNLGGFYGLPPPDARSVYRSSPCSSSRGTGSSTSGSTSTPP